MTKLGYAPVSINEQDTRLQKNPPGESIGRSMGPAGVSPTSGPTAERRCAGCLAFGSTFALTPRCAYDPGAD
jgi:hypothetical protein